MNAPETFCERCELFVDDEKENGICGYCRMSEDEAEWFYFAPDGNWGSMDGVVEFDTRRWTQADWEAVSEARDRDKVATAQAIDERIAGESND